MWYRAERIRTEIIIKNPKVAYPRVVLQVTDFFHLRQVLQIYQIEIG